MPKPASNNRNTIFILSILTITFLCSTLILLLLYIQAINKPVDPNAFKPDPIATEKQVTSIEYSLEPDVFEVDTTEMPSWIRSDLMMEKGPWENDLYIADSSDGKTFGNGKFFMSHAGVPNLITTSGGKLIATFQYFSFINEELFDQIVYTISEDNGESWSKIKMLEFSGLDANNSVSPVDPTLVELEDGRLRLYFTYQIFGEENPSFHSAIATGIDKTFVLEGKQLASNEIVLDPAVVLHNGTWHHFTTYNEQGGATRRNLHSTSQTGINFTKQDDVFAYMSFLGDALSLGNEIWFYGTGQDVMLSTSRDGVQWSMSESTGIEGADPGVSELADGSFLMIYTGF